MNEMGTPQANFAQQIGALQAQVVALTAERDVARQTLVEMRLENAAFFAMARQAVELRDADVAEQIRQRERATSLAAQLDAIIDAIADGLYVCDMDGKIVRVNRRGLELLGLVPTEIGAEGALRNEIVPLRNPDGTLMADVDRPLTRGLRGETGIDLRGMVVRRDGQETHLLLSYAPMRGNNGTTTGAVAIATDISELHRLEQQKDEFLSIASHELKTPVTTIKGLSQLAARRLARAGHSAEADLLRTVVAQTDRLTGLVNTLLDVSRIQNGHLALQPAPFDIVAIIQTVITALQATTDHHSIYLRAPIHIELTGDAARIEQVVTNLVGNAIKYSPNGGDITVEVAAEAGVLRLRVRDDGVGVPPQDRTNLFARFQRGSNVENSGISGFGLGLFISHQIVEAHGGRIWLDDDTRARGSTFCVELPL